MEHNTCRENLSAFLDGELAAAEKVAVESHLAGCPECSRELAELKRVSAIFKKHAMQPAPLSLKGAVFTEKRESPFFSGWLKPAAAFAAVAAGLVVILTLPKDREGKIASPELYSSAAPQEAPARAEAGKTEPAPPAPVLPAVRQEAAGRSGPRYALPSSPRGAFGQAKSAGGALSKARGESAASAASLSGGAAGSAYFTAAAVRGAIQAAPAADKEAEAPPKWVADLIRKYQEGPRGNPPFSVWQYRYKGMKVYYLPPQCCDQYSALYDGKGALLCAPDGGKTGGGDGKCGDFFSLRLGGELLWQDPRGGN